MDARRVFAGVFAKSRVLKPKQEIQKVVVAQAEPKKSGPPRRGNLATVPSSMILLPKLILQADFCRRKHRNILE
jgi:hypothetical protein